MGHQDRIEIWDIAALQLAAEDGVLLLKEDRQVDAARRDVNPASMHSSIRSSAEGPSESIIAWTLSGPRDRFPDHVLDVPSPPDQQGLGRGDAEVFELEVPHSWSA